MQAIDPRLQLIRRALEHLRGLGIETDSESECSLAHEAVAALREVENELLPEAPDGVSYEKFEQMFEAGEAAWRLQFSVDGLPHVARGSTMREAAMAALRAQADEL
jgi:hypothetical protein